MHIRENGKPEMGLNNGFLPRPELEVKCIPEA
jgi:hypothetical protein